MMRIIENPKCIRNFTSQPTISSIPSASRHQPAMTLLQVRELLAKNREEYDELIELEKKLISGGNCGNDEEDGEDGDESEGEEQEQDDGEDEGGVVPYWTSGIITMEMSSLSQVPPVVNVEVVPYG
ncbi:uncharacterized protein A4U43_C09F12490 [Asparagus officinalis]|uniref:Uncharacterized protein n=1 Tax=Asparagus officinalis TaxID=4686 RepID=A0A5P1E786_ASPOF|nr:uncharacterized protein A4U43_C09F12490 [Asparagus officinalis]